MATESTKESFQGESELDDEEWEDFVCTCDFDEPENCPAHYPIDDGSDGEEGDE